MTTQSAPDEPRSVDTVSTTDANGVAYTHYIEPELRTKAIPRHVRLTDANQITRRWLWSLAVGCILLGIFVARSKVSHFDALMTHGVVLQGAVTDIEDNSDSDGSSYQIRYAFDAEGYRQTSRYSVNKDTFLAARHGDPVAVTYLPGSGGRVWEHGFVTSESVPNAILGCGMAGGLCALAFAIFAWGFEQAWGREVRLLREGVAVQGVVRSGAVTSDGEGGYGYSFTYSYWTGKRSHRNTISVTRDVYEAHTQGNPYLTVLYDAEEPDKSRAYFQINAACFEAPTIR